MEVPKKTSDYIPPPITGKKEDYPKEHEQYMERQAKESSKGIFVRCRNVSEKRLSREFHDVEISIVLNAKIMQRSSHVVEDLKINEKIDLYCKRENKNRNKLNLRHIAGATESQTK